MHNTSVVVDTLERKELIEKLIECGYGELVEVLLSNEHKVYTKNGRRLNKCGVCRALGWKPKKLEDALLSCREILKGEF